jgi:predicted MFS family arabinose efflux permease
LLAAPSGFLANILGWHDFFLLSIAVSLPALIILYIYQIRNNYLIGQP